MKIINYFIKLSLIIIVLVVAKSSTNVATTKVENDNINKTINLSTKALKLLKLKKH